MTSASLKAPDMRTLNVRVPAGVYQQLAGVAKARACTKGVLAQEALASYLQLQDEQLSEIELGLAEADQGLFATDAEVKAVFAKYGA